MQVLYWESLKHACLCLQHKAFGVAESMKPAAGRHQSQGCLSQLPAFQRPAFRRPAPWQLPSFLDPTLEVWTAPRQGCNKENQTRCRSSPPSTSRTPAGSCAAWRLSLLAPLQTGIVHDADFVSSRTVPPSPASHAVLRDTVSILKVSASPMP